MRYAIDPPLGSASDLLRLTVQDITLGAETRIFFSNVLIDTTYSTRRMFGYPTTFRSRITELEQTENWVDALTEYGSVHFKRPETRKSHKYGENGGHKDFDQTLSMIKSESEKDGRGRREEREGPVIDMTVDSPLSGSAGARSTGRGTSEGQGQGGAKDRDRNRNRNRNRGRDAMNNGVTASNASWRRESEEAKQGDEEGVEEEEEEEEDGSVDAWSQSAELERGRLRCLLELGHLDAIVDQVAVRLMAVLCNALR